MKAKEYALEVNTNPDTLTLPFGNKGDITLYLDASNEYLYDVHDQLIRTETYAEDQSPRVLERLLQ